MEGSPKGWTKGEGLNKALSPRAKRRHSSCKTAPTQAQPHPAATQRRPCPLAQPAATQRHYSGASNALCSLRPLLPDPSAHLTAGGSTCHDAMSAPCASHPADSAYTGLPGSMPTPSPSPCTLQPPVGPLSALSAGLVAPLSAPCQLPCPTPAPHCRRGSHHVMSPVAFGACGLVGSTRLHQGR